jgi:Family of unknown function (DUF6114)
MAEVRTASWRSWRRTRPFWGGLLLCLAGIELIGIPLSGVLSHGAVRLVIYIGIGGVFGVLIGVLLVACGIAVWVNPAHRLFYGIAGALLGILSFPASNLGGFFVGMLLAIVGGSIAFAWAPTVPGAAGDEWAVGGPGAHLPGVHGPAADAAPADDPSADTDPSGSRGHRMLAIAALPLVLLAGSLGAAAAPGAPAAPGAETATATQARPSGTCILLILCVPSPSPTPTPSPSPSGSGAPQPSPGSPGSPGSSPQSGQSGRPGKHRSAQRRAAADAGLVAATATSVIKAGSGTLDGLAYQGAANVPVAGGGTVRMMKFTATSITLSGDVTASVTQRGPGAAPSVTTVTTSPTLAFSGGVVLYATRLSGCLGPLCVTLTPDNAVTVLLRLASDVTGALTLTLTRVITDQPLLTAGALQAGALKISFG